MTKGSSPTGRNPNFVEFGLRASIEEGKLINEAAAKEAKRLNIFASRNNFILRAVLAAAKKEMDIDSLV